MTWLQSLQHCFPKLLGCFHATWLHNLRQKESLDI
jgi:hypothetical protein